MSVCVGRAGIALLYLCAYEAVTCGHAAAAHVAMQPQHSQQGLNAFRPGAMFPLQLLAKVQEHINAREGMLLTAPRGGRLVMADGTLSLGQGVRSAPDLLPKQSRCAQLLLRQQSCLQHSAAHRPMQPSVVHPADGKTSQGCS